MSLSLSILGSGSSGNASIVRADHGAVLIDAGLGPRTVAKRLRNTGASVADVRAIVLTHLDGDHFSCTWVNTIVASGVRVYVHASRADDLLRRAAECDQLAAFAELVTPFDGTFEPLAGVAFDPIALPHDEHGSHGYVVTHDDATIGYATDLGRVPPALIERFAGVDVVAIESNYDVPMQIASGRPPFLQNRIMGGRGHLSNAQALAAVKAIFARCDRMGLALPAHVALLHRSRQCNCPTLLREFFSTDPRVAARLTLSEPFAPTPWLCPTVRDPLPGEQMALAFGGASVGA